MLTSPQTELVATGEWIKNMLPGAQSVERGLLKLTQTLYSGTVLATLTGGIMTVAYAGTGNGVLTPDATDAVIASAGPGRYTATCTVAAANGGTFSVEDPDGTVLGTVAVGATFATQIKFVIADGSVDFAVGDKFTMTVYTGSNRYCQVDPAGAAGTEVATAILISPNPADSSTRECGIAVLARGAEVNPFHLTYPTAATPAQKALINTQLAAVGILVRP